MQLFICRFELFIRGLQFFVRRFELFIGGLQFFVGRFQLFVGRLQFFARSLELFDRGLQFFAMAYVFGIDERTCALAVFAIHRTNTDREHVLSVIDLDSTIEFDLLPWITMTLFQPLDQFGTARRQGRLGNMLADQFAA